MFTKVINHFISGAPDRLTLSLADVEARKNLISTQVEASTSTNEDVNPSDDLPKK